METRSSSSSMAVLLVIAIAVAVGLGWFLAKRSVDSVPTTAVRMGQAGSVLQKKQVHLYFADSSGRYLSAEQRVVDQPDDVASAAHQLVAALIQGPLQGGGRTLPQNSSLRNLFITSDGVAYVDFTADALDRHPGGVATELLTIYSIVNSLVLNLEQVREVKFLIGGKEAATLVGHVDLSRPFKADMLWIR
jgi:spore germination protein GerM